MLNHRIKNHGVFIAVTLIFLVCTTCSPPVPVAKPPAVPPVNRAPVVSAIVGTSEWKPSSEGSLICAATDPDGDKLNYIWSADNGTIKGEGMQVTWVTPDTLGEYSIACKVSDGKGGEATASKSFKVVLNPYGNDTPDATIYLTFALPSYEVVKDSHRVRIWTTSEIQSVIPNRDASVLTYKWSSPVGKLNGNGIADGKASRVGWIAPGVAGIYTVAVTVTDKAGNEAKGEVSFDVLCCRD